MRHIRATIRLICFVAMTIIVYLIWMIGALLIPNRQFWRQIIFRFWARAFLVISGMRVEIIGTPPRPPFLLVSNHLGYIDVAAFRAVLDTVFVAKSDIRNWFLAGWIVRDMGTIFINRRNRRDIPRAGKEIVSKLEDGEGVVIFPEGTSTKGEEVLPFNSSLLEFAARRGLPVFYASITYRTPSDAPSPSEVICWWDDTVFLEHLWRLLSLKEFTAVINFGEEPINRSDRKELAHELREKVKEKFIPVI
ncbi:MAG: lysophospholipid acyltransferase family protein [Pyrinomonadaceae bacterium]